MEQVAETGPQELRLRMRAGAQFGEFFGGVLELEDLNHLGRGFAAGRTVIGLADVEHRNGLADLAEDAGAGFLSQRALGDQCLEPVGGIEVAVPGIARQGVGHGLDDMRHGVQPDHVGGAVGGALRPAQ